MVVTLDFKEHKELFEAIKAQAVLNLRTVENQMIYRLRETILNTEELEAYSE
jgi:hypothetical protein